MNISSQIKVLSEDSMGKVHEKALELLYKRGIVFQSDDAVATFRHYGAKVEGNTVFIGKELIEKSLAQCPKTFGMEGLNPQKSVTVGEGMLVHPAGGEVFITDSQSHRRIPTLKDYANLQKVYHSCDNVDFGGFHPLSPMDVNPRVKGLYCVLTSMQCCDKPILSPSVLETLTQKEECLEMFDIAFGKKGYLDNHHVTWLAVCPNSPFFYSDYACEGIKVYAQKNQPVVIVSAPMTGITSPIYLFSTLILTIAETLAGIVYAQLIKPGVPVVPSSSLTYGNMRYATWECAAPDTALLLGASVQMFNDFYNLPSRAQTGVTSSKTIDYQSGMETMQSFLFTAMAGVNVTSQSVGTLGNLMASSLEKAVLDNEIISRVRYMIKGMNTDIESMGMDDLLQAKPCQDFLTNESTMNHLKEGWQPSVSHWGSYEAWEKEGEEDVLAAAHRKVEEILANAPNSLLDSEQEKEMKKFIANIEKNS
ncbi:MAG: trimethylamine methyltransferase family protein [Clostridiales bacterium]